MCGATVYGKKDRVVACLASPITVELCRTSINEVNNFLSRFAPPSRFAPHYAKLN